MSSALDRSLEDIIKSNKKPGSGGRGRGGSARGGASGPGPARRIPDRSFNRLGPYAAAAPMVPDMGWQHDMFVDPGLAFQAQAVQAASAIETGTKLYISNLDYGVTNEDVKELFSEVGDLKRYAIHYDRSGRSKGTAEVVFSRREDGLAAVKRYNNVQLDGKPMKIEIVGTNIVTPAPMPPMVVNGNFGNPIGFGRGGQGRGGGFSRPRGGRTGGGGGRGFGRGRGGRGRGGGRGGEKISAEDLDAELEKYHSEAMQES
ncbi:THO complex subunit 4A [Linum perenne]